VEYQSTKRKSNKALWHARASASKATTLEGKRIRMKSFPFYHQPDTMDCGPTALRMVAKYHGRGYTLQQLRALSNTNRSGSSMLGLSEAAEKIGLKSLGVKVSYNTLEKEVPLPCIAHWSQNHFVVIYKIKGDSVTVADPAHGLLKYNKEDFKKRWVADGKDEGILLLLEPTANFLTHENNENPKRDFSFLFQYLHAHKRLIVQLIIGLLAGSLLQLIFPFLTQSIIDIGIRNHDVHFIYLILGAQLALFLGRMSIEILRSWILLHISSRVNISLISDFFIKLMKLPIAYFDSKMTGDLMQRINDHYRIESFLTGSSLSTLFSVFNLIVFSFVLAWYNLQILLVFAIGSLLYFLWVRFFMKRRADLDFKSFRERAANQSKEMELIQGMQEIKLHNAERQKRWQWEIVQIRLFKVRLQGLALSQVQNSGSAIINEIKNIGITFLAALLVLKGSITLGAMLSISYIIGQLNAPVIELVHFMQQLQDAKLSFERLSEIHNLKDEESTETANISKEELAQDIVLENCSFKYDVLDTKNVLEDISLKIPAGKTTAIVGASGSGKTTLMKVLLKFYEPQKGTIKIGHHDLRNISHAAWRSRTGVVMQEGYIFSDTIANNIAVGAENIEVVKVQEAAALANIKSFVEQLPLGYNTKIGLEGMGLSTGQKQRLLIARAIYKNPETLLFDEATSSLDANNEKEITENLSAFFKNKTVLIIAHRLSTVRHADQIVVLDEGKVAEVGTHNELVSATGKYYELVKNQLELGG
jgi:ATP-binding cassette subfamily B protein